MTVRQPLTYTVICESREQARISWLRKINDPRQAGMIVFIARLGETYDGGIANCSVYEHNIMLPSTLKITHAYGAHSFMSYPGI